MPLFRDPYPPLPPSHYLTLANPTMEERTIKNPLEGSCSFFVHTKKRYCKLRTKEGANYCGEHRFLDGIIKESNSRITCPLDSKQYYSLHKFFISLSTVDKDQLQAHLKKCNNRPLAPPIFFSLNVNNSNDVNVFPVEEASSTKEEKSLKELYLSLVKSPVNVEEFCKPDAECLKFGKSTRHLHQNDKLADLILKNVPPGVDQVVMVELGAGKGGLSLHVAQKVDPVNGNWRYILIDRKNFRRKSDVFLKNMNVNFERYFIDIKDLDLNQLLPSDCERVVFTGKHLCGSATCLSLKAISKLAMVRPTMNISIVIATCCHQVCSWESFCGRLVVGSSAGETCISPKDFSQLCRSSSWTELPEGIDPITFGLYSKLFIDQLRLKYLESAGFHCRYIEYVDKGVSLENKCLLANKN